MEIFAGLSVAFLFVTALVVAIKTFALWLRTRELPELLLSVMLFLVTVLGYPVALACMFVPAKQFLPVHLVYAVVFNTGFTCLAFFTLRVFRPNAAWAKVLVAAMLVVFVASSILYLAEVLGEDPRLLGEMHELGLLNLLGVGTAYFWTTIESLHYYRRLRLRVRVGLASAVVANRILLWGLMTLSAGIAVVINTFALLAGALMDPLTVAISSGFGVAHATCLLFALKPPAWYRGWVERRSAAEAR